MVENMSKTKTSLIPDKKLEVIHIGLVGGGDLCKEMLEKTAFDYTQEEAYAFILAVADPDSEAPGMVLARERGLLTFSDYHQLYDPRYNIHLIITLTPEDHVLEDILKTRPLHIRVMAYHVFKVFWNAIDFKARKLKIRNEEVETILNGIQDFITVITPDLDIIEVNEALLEKMGYARQDVIGRKCHQIFQQISQPCNTEEFPCPLNEAIRNKRPLPPDSHPVWIQSRTASYRGQCLSCLGKRRQDFQVHSYQPRYYRAQRARGTNDPAPRTDGR